MNHTAYERALRFADPAPQEMVGINNRLHYVIHLVDDKDGIWRLCDSQLISASSGTGPFVFCKACQLKSIKLNREAS